MDAQQENTSLINWIFQESLVDNEVFWNYYIIVSPGKFDVGNYNYKCAYCKRFYTFKNLCIPDSRKYILTVVVVILVVRNATNKKKRKHL